MEVPGMPLPLLASRAQGEREQLRTGNPEPPGLTGLGMAVNKMEIYFKGGEKSLLTLHHSHLLVGKIRMV